MAGTDIYTDGVAANVDDDNDLTKAPANGIVAAVAGVVAVYFHGETTSRVIGIGVGVVLPIKIDRVLSTGTTATGLVVLY